MALRVLDGGGLAANKFFIMLLLKFPVLYICNAAQLIQDETGYKIFGDPTEGSLLTAAAKAGILKDEQEKKFSYCYSGNPHAGYRKRRPAEGSYARTGNKRRK